MDESRLRIRPHAHLARARTCSSPDGHPVGTRCRGGLLTHKVCYLSGPNLTRAAAVEVATRGSNPAARLFLTAGAASRDEFNRSLDTLTPLLPAQRAEAAHVEPYQNSGKFLSYLNSKETVTWGDEKLEVLSMKQELFPLVAAKSKAIPEANDDIEILATFQDGKPAVVSGRAGKGRVIVCGFLPALSYIKPALRRATAARTKARRALRRREARRQRQQLSARSDQRDRQLPTQSRQRRRHFGRRPRIARPFAQPVGVPGWYS